MEKGYNDSYTNSVQQLLFPFKNKPRVFIDQIKEEI